MKKMFIVLVLALTLIIVAGSSSLAFAGGGTTALTEVGATEGIMYMPQTIETMYPGLNGKFLSKWGSRFFFPAGKNKKKLELNLVEGDNIVHVALKRTQIRVVTSKLYTKWPLVALMLDSEGNVTRATVFRAPGRHLFAPRSK